MVITPEDLPGDLLDLLLDEVERALLWVDARDDEPGRRLVSGELPDAEEEQPDGVSELRMSIAELVDAHPSVQYDLERVGERMRTVGAGSASAELAQRSYLLDIARLSLETFFRLYPEADNYENEQSGRSSEEEDSGRTPAETYQALREVLEMLKSRLS